jgi:hypothetical protein
MLSRVADALFLTPGLARIASRMSSVFGPSGFAMGLSSSVCASLPGLRAAASWARPEMRVGMAPSCRPWRLGRHGIRHRLAEYAILRLVSCKSYLPPQRRAEVAEDALPQADGAAVPQEAKGKQA